MKKLVLISVFAVFATSNMWGAACSLGTVTGSAGSFSSATTADQLIALGATGCTFNGYTLSNFSLDASYSDFGYGGDTQYNYLTDPSTMANYVIGLTTAPDGLGLALTVQGKVTQSDLLAPWTIEAVSVDDPLFTFKLKYNISSFTSSVSNLKNVTLIAKGSNSTGLQAQSTNQYKKTIAGGPNLNLLVPTGGDFTSSITAPLGSLSLIQVTDQIVLSMNEPSTDGLTMTATSLTNIFDPAPEPMTMALMGIGLAGLAMIRRRSNKN